MSEEIFIYLYECYRSCCSVPAAAAHAHAATADVDAPHRLIRTGYVKSLSYLFYLFHYSIYFLFFLLL